jgi:hypothetical protein
MPVSLLAQVSLENDSLLPEDRVVNTFSFTAVDDQVGTLADIKTRLTTFYQTNPPLRSNSVKDMLSSTLNLTLGRLKIYNRADLKPRAPKLDTDFPLLPGSTGAAFPNEVALVLSFRGPTIAGGNPQRRRGRVYIGPLATVYSELVNSDVRPNLLAQQILSESAARLMNTTTLSTVWVVHSEVNGNDVSITQGHVDNAYDTQRRRGRAPTSRVAFASV